MANYSPGELANFNYITEAVYGTTPATALVWGCTIESAKPKVNAHQAFHLGSTSRSYSDVTKGAWDIGFKLKGWSRALSVAIQWRDFWAMFGMGSITALTEHLPSFSAQFRFDLAADVYWHFNGCKINKLKLSCDGPGQLIDFEADVIARWVEKSLSKTLAGLQAGVVVGANATDVTTAILTWSGVSQINIAAGGLVDWHPKSWSIEIDNGLDVTMGNIYGADTLYYHCARAIQEGKRDIIFTCEVDLENETYNTAKLAGSAITSLTIPIDDDTITLANGEIMLEDDDLPEFKRAIMVQPLRIRFKSIAVA
jgi:hypothetical protein